MPLPPPLPLLLPTPLLLPPPEPLLPDLLTLLMHMALRPLKKFPIVSSLDEWLKQPTQIDFQEVHQSPSFLYVANTIIMTLHTHHHDVFLRNILFSCDFITVIFRTHFLFMRNMCSTPCNIKEEHVQHHIQPGY
jgi:hypothetical protein